MRKVSLSLFVLSVIAILLALYYPEQPQLAADCTVVDVETSHCDCCAVEVVSDSQNACVVIDSIVQPMTDEAVVELEVCQPECDTLADSAAIVPAS